MSSLENRKELEQLLQFLLEMLCLFGC